MHRCHARCIVLAVESRRWGSCLICSCFWRYKRHAEAISSAFFLNENKHFYFFKRGRERGRGRGEEGRKNSKFKFLIQPQDDILIANRWVLPQFSPQTYSQRRKSLKFFLFFFCWISFFVTFSEGEKKKTDGRKKKLNCEQLINNKIKKKMTETKKKDEKLGRKFFFLNQPHDTF